jgi:hypothetical protein
VKVLYLTPSHAWNEFCPVDSVGNVQFSRHFQGTTSHSII